MGGFFCYVCNASVAGGRRHVVEEPYGFYDLIECTICGIWISDFNNNTRYETQLSNHRFGFITELFLKILKVSRYIFIVRKIGMSRRLIIDWGCGRGELVEYFTKKGWKAFGVEYNQDTGAEALARGINIYFENSDNSSLSIPDSLKSNVVLAYHFLEHVQNPREMTERIWNTLENNGFYILEVPNVDSLQQNMSKRNWLGYDCQNHYSHFNINALKILLKSELFEIISISTFSLEYGVSMMVQTLLDKITPIKKFAFNMAKCRFNLHNESIIRIILSIIVTVFFILPVVLISFFIEIFACFIHKGGVIRIVAKKVTIKIES